MIKTDAAPGKRHTQDNPQAVHRNCGKAVGVTFFGERAVASQAEEIHGAIGEASGSMRSAETAPANPCMVRSLNCGGKIFLYE